MLEWRSYVVGTCHGMSPKVMLMRVLRQQTCHVTTILSASRSDGDDEHGEVGVVEEAVRQRGVEDAREGVAPLVGDGYEIYTVFFEEGVDVICYAALVYLCRFAPECREMLCAIFQQCLHAFRR